MKPAPTDSDRGTDREHELRAGHVIRVVHILVGVIWAGSAIFLAGFLDPRLRALGPDVHRRVLGALYVPLRFVLEGGGAITILVGIALVFRLQRIDDLLDTNWGWAITIGLVTSVIAHTTGVLALTSLKKLGGADDDRGRPADRPCDDARPRDGGDGHRWRWSRWPRRGSWGEGSLTR